MEWIGSIVVLAVLAMIGGAWLAFRNGDRKRALLMLLLALVMAANVAIWSFPGPDGEPVDTAAPY